MSEYFPFYDSYKKAISKLPDEERLKAYDAITNYGIYGVEPEDDDSIAAAIFAMAKPSIDKAKKNKTNGSAGGRKKEKSMVQENEVEYETDGSEVENENDKHYNKDNNNNDNENKDENDNKDNNKQETEKNKNSLGASAPKNNTGFVPPSWSDVSGYILDKGLNVSADKFMEYYTANGWMVGKQPMKDWRMTLRNWDKREKNGSGKGKTGSKDKSGKGGSNYDNPRTGADKSAYANQGASAQAAGTERPGSGLGEWY